MFFSVLGRFIRRAWAFLLLAWIVLLLDCRQAELARGRYNDRH